VRHELHFLILGKEPYIAGTTFYFVDKSGTASGQKKFIAKIKTGNGYMVFGNHILPPTVRYPWLDEGATVQL